MRLSRRERIANGASRLRVGHTTMRPARRCKLFIVSIHPGAGKQILPGTLWRDEKGLRWRWKAIPSPRPLYGLDKIAARPYAPVIVCEGEKAAEAAAKIFPDHVAVTSSNGAGAAKKADWSPLSRRRVTIWPDNDEDWALTYAR